MGERNSCKFLTPLNGIVQTGESPRIWKVDYTLGKPFRIARFGVRGRGREPRGFEENPRSIFDQSINKDKIWGERETSANCWGAFCSPHHHPRDSAFSLQRLRRFYSFLGSVGQKDLCSPSGHSRCLKAEAKQQITKPPSLPHTHSSHSSPFQLPRAGFATLHFHSVQTSCLILYKNSGFALTASVAHGGPLPTAITVRFLPLPVGWCSLGSLCFISLFI